MNGFVCSALLCIGGWALLFCLGMALLAYREREAAGLFVVGALLCGLLLILVFVVSQVPG